jgi:hypothetical protein
MGNARVMTVKVIWDTAFYWAVFGLLFFHNAYIRLADSPGIAANLARFTTLSNRFQVFLREWDAIDRPASANEFVDMYVPLAFMRKLHTDMIAGFSPAKLDAQLAANVQFFERLAGQIISTAIELQVDHFENEAVLPQIQRWQTEPYIAGLIALYRKEGKVDPIPGYWMSVGQSDEVIKNREEVAR